MDLPANTILIQGTPVDLAQVQKLTFEHAFDAEAVLVLHLLDGSTRTFRSATPEGIEELLSLREKIGYFRAGNK